MQRSYSILILPWRGTRMRRLVFSQKSIRYLLSAGTVLLGFGAWFLGDYLLMKLQKNEVRDLKVEARAHRQQLSLLKDQTRNIQVLLANWKGLRENIRSSLPPQH